MKNGDTTDAGYPLNIVLYSPDGQFDPAVWHRQKKVVIMINNGIHPGEPDGIDACMMFLRDIAGGKIKTPPNIAIAVIPVYNIGGSLNRNSFSRVNQDGPESYGFRGNAQNLDLNRDFIKADSKNAIAFEKIYQWLNPDVFCDNHVSDGADYQYTMTLISTQHNKLQGEIGDFAHDVFDSALYRGMAQKNWPMIPYVNVEGSDPSKGWEAFYESPRYSSGYAALFETISFISETHMLKPFADRVWSTYYLMQTLVEQSSVYAAEIIAKRQRSLQALQAQKQFAVSWKVDTTHYDMINFKGYEPGYKTSDVTGKQRMFYDRTRPYNKPVKFYNTYVPAATVEKPKAYIIPQGWWYAINLLKINGVAMKRLAADTTIEVECYHIDDYKSMPRAYEKHHRNYNVALSTQTQAIKFLKGDYVIYTGQPHDRYIVETLEPLGDDSYFSWNFFDAVLQEKEGYADYRWEDVAAAYLQQHPGLKQQLEDKKKADPKFAASASAQLNFVYKNSPYYEPAHNRYPVYRLVK
ncbi:MAG TPA: hypothetical protein VHB48_21480 [Chitinophagaceae bacterium]|nr:hypothetical protein [Chitinophagaceae bacterium]